MDKNELAALATRMIEATRDFVSKAKSEILGVLDERIKALPGPAAVDYVHVAGLIKMAVAALPAPAPGKDADPELVRVVIAEEVAKAFAAMPKPRDGADADPVLVATLIEKSVAAAVAALPKAKDGKDADPDVIRRLIAEAVDALPKPQDGKNASPEQIRSAVDLVFSEMPTLPSLVRDAVAALPKPKDGENGVSVSIDDVRPVIAATVAEAVAALPKPMNGKNVSPDEVRQVVVPAVAEAVAALPKPKDGKNADAELVRLVVAEVLPGMLDKAISMLSEQIDAGLKVIPVPKDGVSIHPDTVALMVRKAVEESIAALPKPKDGDPGRDASELTVLSSINEERSYPAGTYARHNGGELRAERRTDPVKGGDLQAAGWTVAREGIAAVVFTQGDDLREITCAAMLTSGVKTLTTFFVPMILDKGVWREGEYARGDHVSWDGSGWIAQRKTSAKPGTSPEDWRLSTKRGRDGRDAEATSPIQKGPVRIK